MGHFALVDDNGTVTQVIAVGNEVLGETDFPDAESVGKQFIADTLRLAGDWWQTSLTGSFRYNYAGIGFTFDPAVGEHGAFIAPQPFPSWTLDDAMKWQPPVPQPTDGERYEWNEQAQEWQVVTV